MQLFDCANLFFNYFLLKQKCQEIFRGIGFSFNDRQLIDITNIAYILTVQRFILGELKIEK
jgi:hypothetical protein